MRENGIDATITVAVDTLETALGTDLAFTGDAGADADEVVAYLADHLTVTGADGVVWRGHSQRLSARRSRASTR